MTTKKIVLIVGAALAGVTLLVGVFVGAIILFALYSFGTSDAAATAKSFCEITKDSNRRLVKLKILVPWYRETSA